MPHLAPLSWALAPLIFWFILFSFMSSLWWSQTPTFPPYSASSSSKFSTWHWN